MNDNNKLRVLLVSPKPPPRGGIATWTETILNAAKGRKDVEIVHVDIAPRWKQIYQKGYAIRILGGILQGIRDVETIIHSLENERIDAVSVTTSGSLATIRDYVVLRIMARRRIPAYQHIRFGRIPDMARINSVEWHFLKKTMSLATEVIVLDNETLQTIVRSTNNVKVRKIPNCINIEEGKEGDGTGGDIEIVFIGWMIKEKGVEELVESWSTMNDRNVKLCMIGPGKQDYLNGLGNIARRYNRENMLEISGEMEHKSALKRLEKASIFVLPSYTEGFPNTLLEAMMLGKAIVATRVGANEEILNIGPKDACGIVVEKQDVIGLRGALERLVENSEERRELGRRAKERVRREYSTEIVFEKLMNLWKTHSGSINQM